MFGQILRKYLRISKVKMKDIAKELGYDPSYISKWINGINLPNKKNISDIVQTCASYLSKRIFELKKQKLINREFPDEEIPEISTPDELREFIYRHLIASYYKSAKEANINTALIPGQSAYRNVCYSSNLDYILSNLHNHCSNAIEHYDMLEVDTTFSPKDLHKVFASQVKGYCMLFRTREVCINYYISDETDACRKFMSLIKIAEDLRYLDAHIKFFIYKIKPDLLPQFVLTQGCYCIIKESPFKRNKYLLMDDTSTVHEMRFSLHELITDRENVGEIGVTSFDGNPEWVANTFSKPSYVYILNDFSFLFSKKHRKTDSKYIIPIDMTIDFVINKNLKSCNVSIYIIKEKLHEFLREKKVSFCCSPTTVDIKEMKETLKDFFDIIKNNSNLKFYILSDDERKITIPDSIAIFNGISLQVIESISDENVVYSNLKCDTLGVSPEVKVEKFLSDAIIQEYTPQNMYNYILTYLEFLNFEK